MRITASLMTIVCATHFGLAQETPALSLGQLTTFAEQRHPKIASARADIEVARGAAIQAGLYPNPTFEAGSDQLGGGANQFPVLLSQRFVTAGKLTLDQQAAFRQVTQAEQRVVQARFQVLTGVRRAFYAGLAGQQRIDVLKQLVELISKSRDLAERRRKGGQGTRSDVVLLEIELRQIQAQLRNAEAGQVGLVRTILTATGAPTGGTVPTIVGDFDADIAFNDYADLLATLGNVNAQAVAADIEIDRSRILLQRAEVEPIPDITIHTGYQGNSTNPHNQGRITFSMPLPLWNRNQGNRYAAVNAIQRSTADAQSVRVQLAELLADAWRRYVAASEQVKVIVDELVPATTEGIELTRKGYEAGQLNLLSFLTAQQSLSRAYLSYIDTQEQRWLAACDIAGLLQLENFPPPATLTTDTKPVVVPPVPTDPK